MSTTGPSLVPLDRAELIEISGADAVAFAHAQFTSNVAALDVATWQWSAWLTAQGRTRCVFALLRTAQDRLLIWLPLGGATAIRDALARFVLRAKVRLALCEGWALCRLDAASAIGEAPRRIADCLGGHAFAQPGPGPRVAWLGPAPSAYFDASALNEWRLADIAAGLPWLASATQDEFVPQALDLERLDAVRFDKGCYPGQEIAARLHFRGGAKQRLHRISLSGDGDTPPGMRVEGDTGVAAGTLLYCASVSPHERQGLAVLSDASIGSSLKTASMQLVHIYK